MAEPLISTKRSRLRLKVRTGYSSHLLPDALDRDCSVREAVMSIDEELSLGPEVWWSPASSASSRDKTMVTLRGALHPSTFVDFEGVVSPWRLLTDYGILDHHA